ncbi:MAG: polysaccharide deacetylase family protein, partial [Candidatus Omnitrophota bacterium]
MKQPLKTKRRFKKIICSLAEGTGYQAFAERYLHRRHPLRILLYHSISDTWEDDLNVRVGDFEEQMAYLADHYQVLSLQEAFQKLTSGDAFPEKSIVLTFDDGYKDNFHRAYPVLEKYRLPATIFLLLSWIGTDR